MCLGLKAAHGEGSSWGAGLEGSREVRAGLPTSELHHEAQRAIVEHLFRVRDLPREQLVAADAHRPYVPSRVCLATALLG